MKCIMCKQPTEKLFCTIKCEGDFLRYIEGRNIQQIRVIYQFLDKPEEFNYKVTNNGIDLEFKYSDLYLYYKLNDSEKFVNEKYKKLWIKTFEKKGEMKLSKLKSITLYNKYKIFERDYFTCQYCGRTVEDGIKLVIDHIYPRSLGGKSDLHNLVTSCESCNISKSKTLLDTNVIMKLWYNAEQRNYYSFPDYKYETLQNGFKKMFNDIEMTA